MVSGEMTGWRMNPRVGSRGDTVLRFIFQGLKKCRGKENFGAWAKRWTPILLQGTLEYVIACHVGAAAR